MIFAAPSRRSPTAQPRLHTTRDAPSGRFFAPNPGCGQMSGFFMPVWAKIFPPTPPETWQQNLQTVATHLAENGGTALAAH